MQYGRAKQLLAPVVLWYLRMIARIALSQTRATIIGIAGSVGKTSVREALFAILKDIAPTHMVAGNSETGVPLGLVGLFPSDYSPLDWCRMLILAPFRLGFLKNKRYIIVEMGIDDPYPPKNMEYLLTIVKPHVGIITDESAAHTMQFEKILPSKEILSDEEQLSYLIRAITKEDVKMLSRCTTSIVNGDNSFIMKAASNALTFGKHGTIAFRSYTVTPKQTTFSFSLDTKRLTLQFPNRIFPEELGYVFAPAILAAYKLNIPLDTACALLKQNFVPPKGRESVFRGKKQSLIIDSSYNASRPSVLSFLKLVKELKKQTHRHTVVVLADMLELGNEAEIEHEEVAQALVGVADTLLLVGPLTKRFILPKFKEAQWFPSIVELNTTLEEMPHRSLILFKGSQGEFWLEESIKLLLTNPSDVTRLCRQNSFWKKVKKTAGKWIDV